MTDLTLAFTMWVYKGDQHLAPLAIQRLRVYHPDEPVLVVCESSVDFYIKVTLEDLGCLVVGTLVDKVDREDFLFDRWQLVRDGLPQVDMYIRIDPDTEVKGRLRPPNGLWVGPVHQSVGGLTVWGGCAGFSKEGLSLLLSLPRVGRQDCYQNTLGYKGPSADLITTWYLSKLGIEPMDWPEVCAGSVFTKEMASDQWQAVHPCLEKWIPQHLWHTLVVHPRATPGTTRELRDQLSDLGITRPVKVASEDQWGTYGGQNVLQVDMYGRLWFNGLQIGDLWNLGLKRSWVAPWTISYRKMLMNQGYLGEQVTGGMK